MKKLVTILIILAARRRRRVLTTTRMASTPEKPTVVQAAISHGDITEVVSATGTLEALRTVQVGPQVSGTIKDLQAWTSTPSSRRARSWPSWIRRCCRCRWTSSRRTSSARSWTSRTRRVQLEDNAAVARPRPGAVRQGPRHAAGARAGGADGQEPPVVDRVGPEAARAGAGEPRAGQAQRRVHARSSRRSTASSWTAASTSARRSSRA